MNFKFICFLQRVCAKTTQFKIINIVSLLFFSSTHFVSYLRKKKILLSPKVELPTPLIFFGYLILYIILSLNLKKILKKKKYF